MENLYIVVIIVVCFVITRKLISSFDKTQEENQDIIDQIHSNKENDFSAEHINSNDLAYKETIVADEKNAQLISNTKNSFLYPDDDFGTMTKGKVFNSIVYEYDINDNSNKDKMKIRTIKKKKNSPK